MATYALYTLTIFMFNCYGKKLKFENEIQVIRHFFHVFGEFDWDKYMLTVFGPIKLQGFHERLKDDFDYDLVKFSMMDRLEYFGFETH